MPAKYRPAIGFQPSRLLIRRFVEEYKVTDSEAAECFEETKKFLILCSLRSGSALSPSKWIDRMWHRFLLHTREYAAFCQQLGGFVHHQPAEAPQPGQVERTCTAMVDLYGSIDERFWASSSADCSSCDCCP